MDYRKLAYLFFLINIPCNAQNIEQSKKLTKIDTVLANYFNEEREIIHLHLNKTAFVTDDDIWFGGYVINRKNLMPFFSTNIFIILYDESGTQISEQLVFSSNGRFGGKIKLKKELKSGNYYIHAYTNWMNNFSENESSSYKISIINKEQGIKNFDKVNKNALEISINPEGGQLISDIENSIGISLLDCRENTIEDTKGNIETLDGQLIKTFTLNRFGYGKTTIPISEKKLKISFSYQNERIEKILPDFSEIGIGLEVNNFNQKETHIKVKTNQKTQKKITGKKFYLLVHQDQKTIIEEFDFNSKLEKNFLIDNTRLFHGINTIRIIDEENKEWSKRLFYSNPSNEITSNEITLNQKQSKSKYIEFIGNSEYNNANLSISTLPNDTRGYNKYKTPIEVGLRVNPYLIKPVENCDYYFTNKNRLKNYEFDMVLLNQKEFKYEWETMKISKIEPKYSFDIGLALKGKINEKIKEKTKHKVRLISYHNLIYTQSDVSESGEFLIDDFVVADSTKIDLALLKLPNFDKIETDINFQVMNRFRPFYKPLTFITPEVCSENLYENFKLEFPELMSNVIQLKEVEIKNLETKKKLKYENSFGNFSLRGYKVEEKDGFRTLLDYIAINGFSVSRVNGDISITTKSSRSFTGGTSGVNVFIDGRQLFFYEELDIMFMSDVDEIFLNPFAVMPGINGNQGIIKIYTKKDFKYETKNETFKSFIPKGFSKFEEYKSVDYMNVHQKGFENFGVFGWNPFVKTDDKGQFKFDIENYLQIKSRIFIEGITIDGKIIQKEIINENN